MTHMNHMNRSDLALAPLAATLDTRAVDRAAQSTPAWPGLKSGVRKPRILLVTPEITGLPSEMAPAGAPRLCAKAGGLADVTELLARGLFEKGVDVHVALPNYRRLFAGDPDQSTNGAWQDCPFGKIADRVHFAEDRRFYYRDRIYGYASAEMPDDAIAFQREVIQNIIPRVQPDLIHCHDWMTGLVPAAARRLGIPTLFTVHNAHSSRATLAQIEGLGLDAASFWTGLYYERHPENYEETRESNAVDMLASGIFASTFCNTVSAAFLDEIICGAHHFVSEGVRRELGCKRAAGCAAGILNAPSVSYDPATDMALAKRYSARSVAEGKRANKQAFQERAGLLVDADAPLFFWPSRLDPLQKGCQLLTDILYETVAGHAASGLQVALVADGPFKGHFHDIVNHHGLHNRVAVCEFDESLSRLGYAGSDFTLMPSSFEPCGLSQMVAARYGSLPIVHRTGGLRERSSSVARSLTHSFLALLERVMLKFVPVSESGCVARSMSDPVTRAKEIEALL